MNFFDIKPESLPQDGQYYFNILVITIALNSENWEAFVEDSSIEDLTCVWYLDELTAPEPKAICVYLEDELDQDIEESDIEQVIFSMEIYPHKVIEISKYGIAWYDMIDFNTGDFWSINGEIEEDEEDDSNYQ